jgi:hypothetical protein
MSIRYVVRSGDSLNKIAWRHNLKSWKDVYYFEENHSFRVRRPNPNVIYPGDIVFIPGGAPSPPPATPPSTPAPAPPPPKARTEERQVFKQTFEEELIHRPARDPWGHGDEFAALGEAIWQAQKDSARMARNPIEGGDFDDGAVKNRRVASIPAHYVMKSVNIDKSVRRLPNQVHFGGYIIVLHISRTYNYAYGEGQPTDKVTVSTTTTLHKVLPDQPMSVSRTARSVAQPSSYVDPR